MVPRGALGLVPLASGLGLSNSWPFHKNTENQPWSACAGSFSHLAHVRVFVVKTEMMASVSWKEAD